MHNVSVNNIDNTRLDLVIPGQQHMYLRAPSPQDRQKWLVALGSAKACVDSKELKGTYILTIFYFVNVSLFFDAFNWKIKWYIYLVAALEDTSSLSHKKSELRLYCDLMMQQVHAVKSAATAEGGPEIQVKNYLYLSHKINFKHNNIVDFIRFFSSCF